MKRKHWKLIFMITGGTLFLLVSTLFVHIWMVTKPSENDDLRSRQLARIEFTESLDSTSANSVYSTMMAMEGIRTAKISKDGSAVVYELDPTKQSTDKVINTIISKTKVKAKKTVPNTKGGAEGCPVLDKESITYRVGTFFQNLL